MNDITIYKDIYSLAKPFIDPIIKVWLQPKLESLKNRLEKNKVNEEVLQHTINSKFQEYLTRTFSNVYYLNTIVFPNQKIRLEDIYIPLKLIRTNDRLVFESNDFDNNFFKENSRILISDYAGMGKSTFSKNLIYQILVQKLGIPILIEFKDLNSSHTILDEIYNQLNPIDNFFDKKFILQLVNRGDFIIVLDGFDEIKKDHQSVIIKDVKTFVSKASENTFVITSRPEIILSSFGEFQEFNIRPLTYEQAFALIRKLDKIGGIDISERLIDNICSNYNSIEYFLKNPLLTSLLFKSFSYHKDLPSIKSAFYDELYGALYKAHDLSKDGYRRKIESNLDFYEFRRILREIAFESAKIRLVEYSESELIELIVKAKSKHQDLNFNPSDFLNDIVHSVPLFIRDGNRIRWSHKSIEDYFAAEFICYHPKKEDICNKIYQSETESFINILTFIKEIDSYTFNKCFLLNVLMDFVEHYEKNQIKLEERNRLNIEYRKAASFGLICFYIKSKKYPNKSDKELCFNYLTDLIYSHYPEYKNQLFRIKRFSAHNATIYSLTRNTFKRMLTQIFYEAGINIFAAPFNLSFSSKVVPYINEFETPILLDDSPNNVLNSFNESKRYGNNFNYVNSTLAYCFNDTNVLDINKVKARIRIIEKNMNREQNEDFLAGI